MKHDEAARQARASADHAVLARLQRGRQRLPPRVDHGPEDTGHGGQTGQEHRVDCDVPVRPHEPLGESRTGPLRRRDRSREQAGDHRREGERRDPRKTCDHQPLSHEHADDAQVGASERAPHGDLALAVHGAAEHEIGDVGTHDQQREDRHDREHREEGPSPSRDDVVPAGRDGVRHQPGAWPALTLIGMQARGDRRQFGERLRACHARPEPRDHQHRRRAAIRCAALHSPDLRIARERQPRVEELAHPRTMEHGRRDANDGHVPSVDREAPPDDVFDAAELLLPDAVTDDAHETGGVRNGFLRVRARGPSPAESAMSRNSSVKRDQPGRSRYRPPYRAPRAGSCRRAADRAFWTVPRSGRTVRTISRPRPHLVHRSSST